MREKALEISRALPSLDYSQSKLGNRVVFAKYCPVLKTNVWIAKHIKFGFILIFGESLIHKWGCLFANDDNGWQSTFGGKFGALDHIEIDNAARECGASNILLCGLGLGEMGVLPYIKSCKVSFVEISPVVVEAATLYGIKDFHLAYLGNANDYVAFDKCIDFVVIDTYTKGFQLCKNLLVEIAKRRIPALINVIELGSFDITRLKQQLPNYVFSLRKKNDYLLCCPK